MSDITVRRALTGHELLARLAELYRENPRSLDGYVDFSCPELEDAWEVYQVWARYPGGPITLTGEAPDDDEIDDDEPPD